MNKQHLTVVFDLLPGIVVGALFMHYVSVNEIGPRVFWASDLCPEPNVGCGVMPLMVIPAAIIIAGVTMGMIFIRVKLIQTTN